MTASLARLVPRAKDTIASRAPRAPMAGHTTASPALQKARQAVMTANPARPVPRAKDTIASRAPRAPMAGHTTASHALQKARQAVMTANLARLVPRAKDTIASRAPRVPMAGHTTASHALQKVRPVVMIANLARLVPRAKDTIASHALQKARPAATIASLAPPTAALELTASPARLTALESHRTRDRVRHAGPRVASASHMRRGRKAKDLQVNRAGHGRATRKDRAASNLDQPRLPIRPDRENGRRFPREMPLALAGPRAIV